jgi:hypothetical protein
MGAAAFKIYNMAKKRIGNATINLATANFRMQLHTSAGTGTVTNLAVNLMGSLTNEVATANGYSAGGKACTGRVWTVGTGPTIYKFDVDDVLWSAVTNPIANIKFAVIGVSGASAGARFPLCYCSLSSGQFSIAAANRLTVTINTLGVFTLQ